MGDIQPAEAVRPLVGLLACQADLLPHALKIMTNYFGPVFSVSVPYHFTHTQYYAKEMGDVLWRQFVVFKSLRVPEGLADWKIASNQYEQELGVNTLSGRRVNIDPGYLAPGKLVLASTKDHEQRIYLQKGIYAEMTLRVRGKQFKAWDWTYPDYAQAAGFFYEAYRDYLNQLGKLKTPLK